MAGEQQEGKVARESTEKGQIEQADWFSSGGVPMVKIRAAASELIPTVQYGNVLCGPVSVERFVADGDDEHIKREVLRTQSICEQAAAEDRQTIHALLRSNADRASK